MVTNDDEFTPVATFGCLSEAHLAKHLLEAEGIPSMIEGVEVGGVFNGITGLGDQVRVQVRKQDAGRAALLLADAQSRAELPADWEEDAERGAVCELCGEPLAENVAECPVCRAPREGVRASAPRMAAADDSVRRAARAEGIVEALPTRMAEQEPERKRPGCLWWFAGWFA